MKTLAVSPVPSLKNIMKEQGSHSFIGNGVSSPSQPVSSQPKGPTANGNASAVFPSTSEATAVYLSISQNLIPAGTTAQASEHSLVSPTSSLTTINTCSASSNDVNGSSNDNHSGFSSSPNYNKRTTQPTGSFRGLGKLVPISDFPSPRSSMNS